MRSSPPPAPPGRSPRNRSWNVARDATGAALLVIAVLLPWNLYFGVGVPNGNSWLFGAAVAVTVLSLLSVLVTFPAHSAKRAAYPPHTAGAATLRLALNAPYLLLVVGVVLFSLYEQVKYGGTGDVPGGVGPGAIAGVAGALLAAQPVLTGTSYDTDRFRPWYSAARTVGFVAMMLATFSVLFILYWRTRFVIPGFGDPEFGEQNIVVAFTALAYGLVALVVVLVGLRWLISRQASALLAGIALGACAVSGSVVVWTLGVGRDIDAFHGIAQATSTAGIGFEGYLAWAAVAAIVGPLTLRLALTQPVDRVTWQDTIRRGLMLIAVYCIGSVLLRIVDLVTPAILGLPYSPYDSIALMAFDIVAAVVAVWLRLNVKNPALYPVVISAISGVVLILTVCRVVVGVGLAPRILYVAPPEGLDSAVYGNTLAQQITSTFDVVLCFLALAVVAIAVVVLQFGGRERKVRPAPGIAPVATAGPRAEPVTSVVPAPVPAAPTDKVAAVGAATTKLPAKAPRIARRTESATKRIKIVTPDSDATQAFSSGAQQVPGFGDSTQRFSAGTTYTGSGRQPPQEPTP